MNEAISKPIRSPSYPAMSLERAIQAVRKIEEKYRSSPVDRTDGAKLIGFSSLSGPANQALSALASYGLVERAGKGEMRVTARAKAILHPNHVSEKRQALLAAALEPQLYRDLRDRFSDVAVPPEDGVVSYLNRQNFNASAIRPAAKAFLDTLSYLEEAGANESHGERSPQGAASKASGGGPASGGASVGDYVQWESHGVLQFPKPLRVRLVSEDGEWVAVEGSETGIPMSEVRIEEPAIESSSRIPPTFKFAAAEASEPRLMSDEAEWMRNKLSRTTDIRLLVKGEMGPREIGKLIRILEAQKAVLEDEEEIDPLS